MLLQLGAIVLGSILRATIGMMDATLWWLPAGDRSSERRQREGGIDTSANGVSHNAPRPSIEYGGEIDEAGRDRDR